VTRSGPEGSLFAFPKPAGFRRDFGERSLRNWHQKREPESRRDRTMNLNTKTAKLNWIVTLLALTLATVAAQSPFF